MFEKNQEKFLAIKKLNLPLGHYAITGSGPMGVRNLREIGDIDIIVDSELWESLAQKYGIVEEKGIKKIVLENENIEVLGESSFNLLPEDPSIPSMVTRIQQAEIINGLPFESLEHVLFFKRKMARSKDLADIQLIEKKRVKSRFYTE